MAKITYYLLWLFVFTVPWDIVSLPYVGSISRLSGLAGIGTAVLTTALAMRFKKPDKILMLAIAFAVWCAATLLWSVSFGTTYSRAFTYAQLVLSLWMIREFVRTREQLMGLLFAFCMGSFVPMIGLLRNFSSDVEFNSGGRFTGGSVNPNDLGLVLVLGIPIAWHLLYHQGGVVRILSALYFVLAPLSILLTGTRGSFLAAIFALMIVPVTLRSTSLRTYAAAAVLLLVASAAIVNFVPSSIWKRVVSIKGEIEGGRMTGRRNIWRSGMEVFPDHAVLGVGSGAYGEAVMQTTNGAYVAPHSVPLSILVEEGLIGMTIFVVLLGACGLTIIRMPDPQRTLWGAVMLAWLVGSATINWEYRKATWMIFGFVTAQAAIDAAAMRAANARLRDAITQPAEQGGRARAGLDRRAQATS